MLAVKTLVANFKQFAQIFSSNFQFPVPVSVSKASRFTTNYTRGKTYGLLFIAKVYSTLFTR